MNNLTTKYSSYEDAILDISVYTKLLGKNMYSLDELRKFYFEEFKATHKKPSLLNKRYELSRLVSDDYRIRYIRELELKANETLVNLQQTSSAVRPNLDIPDSAYVSSDVKFTFSYENKTSVSGVDDLIQRYNIRTGEALDKGIMEVTNLMGSVQLDQSLEVEDEEEIQEEQEAQDFSFEEEETFVFEDDTELFIPDESEINEESTDDIVDDLDVDEQEYEDDESEESEESEEYEEDEYEEEDYDSEDEEYDESEEDFEEDEASEEEELVEDEVEVDELDEELEAPDEIEDEEVYIEPPVKSQAVVQQPIQAVQKVQQVTQSVTSSPPVNQEPTDIRAFLRKYTKCDIEFLEQYFTKKQINDALKIGKIIKKGNKIRLP